MANFDKFFSDVKSKAASAAEIASKKTAEAVEVSKLKHELKQAIGKVENVYTQIGAIVYEAKKKGESFDELIDFSIQELDELNARIADLEQEIEEVRAPAPAQKEEPVNETPIYGAPQPVVKTESEEQGEE